MSCAIKISLSRLYRSGRCGQDFHFLGFAPLFLFAQLASSSVVDDDDQGLEGDDDLHLVFPFACLRAALKPTCLVIRVQGGAKMHSDFSCIPSSDYSTYISCLFYAHISA